MNWFHGAKVMKNVEIISNKFVVNEKYFVTLCLLMNTRLFIILLVTLTICCMTHAAEPGCQSPMKDSVLLKQVTVTGKSKTQRLREGAFTVSGIDVRSMVASLQSLNELVDRTAGVKVREEGGMGSDFDLSINGMSGNSVRFFLDGVPLDTRGTGLTLANLPVNIIDHVEIYKGVVPTWLGSDALGGAVNIVTNRRHSHYLDASYGVGSFHTHRADLNGQYVLPGGITVRPTLGVNYSKNDYKMRGVELWDETRRKFLPQDRRRFHDDYLSLFAQMEVGVTHQRWADECFVYVSYQQVDKEIQTGQTQERVVGMAERQSHAWSLGARYQKQHLLVDGMSLNLQLSHTLDYAITTDTAYRQYDWNGDYILSGRNELNGRARTRRHYERPLTLLRANLSYQIADGHQLHADYTLNRTGNNRWDDVDDSFTPSDDALTKHILGLAYNQTLLRGKMSNTLFVKDYVNHLRVEQTDIPTVTGSRQVMGSHTNSFTGYGIGTRLELMEPLALKVSYEHSVRLPLARELLGNGTTIYANMALRPESSDNYNLGLLGTLKTDDHIWTYEVNAFWRHSSDYIQPQLSEKEGTMQYVNVPSVHIKGLEAEAHYQWQNRLQLLANISWQDARDRQRLKSDGKPSVTYNNHVPNRPWLFATTESHYTWHHMPSLSRRDHRGGRLQLGLDYQWVHWFYLSWEGYGRKSTKARIPEKNVVGAEATYAWHHDRYSISLQCHNLLDATIYDNYMLQKPGRSVFAKFRVFLH